MAPSPTAGGGRPAPAARPCERKTSKATKIAFASNVKIDAKRSVENSSVGLHAPLYAIKNPILAATTAGLSIGIVFSRRQVAVEQLGARDSSSE